MNDCRADARPDISAIAVEYDYVETWTENGNYFGTVLTAGQTITRTRTGTTTFTRRRVGDFFGKAYDYTGSGGWVENNALAKCGPVSYFDFYEDKDDPASQLLRAGFFVMWHPICCLCHVAIESTGVIIEDGEALVLDGFGGSDGTTNADILLALPLYAPQLCRAGFRMPWADDEGTDFATFTASHAVNGSSTVDAEQLVELDDAGRLDGSLAFDWLSPDGVVYRFVLSATDGEPETATNRAAVPTLDFLDDAPATAADRANFQITLETGPDGSYGSFRIGFIGRFRRRAVNLIEPQAPAPEDGYPGLLLLDYEATPSDQIAITTDTDGQTFHDVEPCASGTGWEIDMAATGTGYVRTGSITFTFTIP